jgi:uncharacterized protein with FMN-binding domain
MRRAVIAIVGTAAGTTLLVGVKVGAAPDSAPAAATAPLDPAPAGPPSATRSTPVPPPAGKPAKRTPRPSTPPPPGRPPAPKPPPPPPPAGGLHAGTFTGPVIQTRYGPVQIQMVVAGGRINDVTALQTPGGNGESVRINKRAVPKLRQEALAAQSAQIDTVSGATYTSEGYRASLQAAIDAAKR